MRQRFEAEVRPLAEQLTYTGKRCHKSWLSLNTRPRRENRSQVPSMSQVDHDGVRAFPSATWPAQTVRQIALQPVCRQKILNLRTYFWLLGVLRSLGPQAKAKHRAERHSEKLWARHGAAACSTSIVVRAGHAELRSVLNLGSLQSPTLTDVADFQDMTRLLRSEAQPHSVANNRADAHTLPTFLETKC